MMVPAVVVVLPNGCGTTRAGFAGLNVADWSDAGIGINIRKRGGHFVMFISIKNKVMLSAS